jgi:hypothetical protein
MKRQDKENGMIAKELVLKKNEGAGFLLAAFAFIIDYYAKIAGYLLAVLLLLIVFSVDVPGIVHSANVHFKMLYVTNMLKDAALAMASILIADISRERTA